MRAAVTACLVSAAMACWFWLAAPTPMGLLASSTAMGVLVTPAALLPSTFYARLLVLAGLIDGIGLVWAVAAFVSPVTMVQWLECYLLLAALLAAVVVSAHVLEGWGLPGVIAACLPILVALAWLTWPVWLSGHLVGRPQLVSWLVVLHPLLAMNGVLLSSGTAPWTEMPIAYQLTALGQDVPYRLPSQPWTGILAHVLLAVTLLGLARGADRLRQGRDVRLAVDVPDEDESDRRQ